MHGELLTCCLGGFHNAPLLIHPIWPPRVHVHHVPVPFYQSIRLCSWDEVLHEQVCLKILEQLLVHGLWVFLQPVSMAVLIAAWLQCRDKETLVLLENMNLRCTSFKRNQRSAQSLFAFSSGWLVPGSAPVGVSDLLELAVLERGELLRLERTALTFRDKNCIV